MEHIIRINKYFIKFINFRDKPLKWEDLNERIQKISSEISISDALKLILSSTGSVTKALEILSGNPIQVKTKFQGVKSVEDGFLDILVFLKISNNDKLNFREVWLTDNVKKYVFALSLTPIMRLKSEFKEDLMKADIPIGKLINKYNIECRREIYQISTINYGYFKEIGIDWLNLEEDAKIPYRIYNIISNKLIIMTIIEFFNPFI